MRAQAFDKNDVAKQVKDYYIQKGDSLKLKAAQFLLENMKYHKSINSELLDSYYENIEEINKKHSYPECLLHYNALYDSLGNVENYNIVEDGCMIDGDTLISYIEAAFNDWQNGLWAQHLSFDDFCEYLLPYRVMDEKFEPWRNQLREKYLPFTDMMKQSEDLKDQAFWAAVKVNDALRKLRFKNQKLLPQLKTDWPISVLYDMHMGTCYDYAKYTTYVMRACGIPVSFDFTPQWPDRAHAHHWNALLDNSGYSIPFMGAESNPGSYNKQGRKLAKVYRRTFAYQLQSLYAQNQTIGERVPPILNSPFIKDVSEEYFKGQSVTVKLNSFHSRDTFVYIAVWNNHEWIPVDFTRRNKDNTASFTHLGSDIVYQPVYWGANGSVPAGDMILLKRDGSEIILRPDTSRRQDLKISRKYPLFDRISQFRHMMDYGVFEAANNPDFSDAIQVTETVMVPQCGYGTIKVKANRKYRFWRYRAAANRKCYLAELKFYDNGEKLAVENVLTEGLGLGNTKPENVFDNDELTYYESKLAKHGWVGADFGKPVNIDKIEYIPRNDDNDIVPGQQYELCYFDGGKEIPLGIQVAKTDHLTFKDVPMGTIYILHNLDKGTEERIFTYDNNQIKWY